MRAHLMRVTDAVSERLAELQLTLGEGPSLDAAAYGGPVLASDLAAAETAARWPVFAPAALQAGAAAVFAFPLRIGAIRAGVMGLYRDRAGPLSTAQLGDALVFADTATLLLLDAQDQARRAGGGAGPAGQPAGLAWHRAEIDQATGMLTEQLGIGITDAFIRLRAYAYVMTVRWPMWPAISWPAACGCALTRTRPRMARREALPSRAACPGPRDGSSLHLARE